MDPGRIHEIVLESMKEAVYIRDLEMNILYINPASEQLTGWSAEEATGKKCYEVFGDEQERCRAACPAEKAIAERSHILHHEGSLKTRSGEIHEMQVSISPIQGAEGITGAVVVMEDITRLKVIEKSRAKTTIALEGEIERRKQTEEKLKESESQKQAILDGIATNLAFVNESLEILWVNKTAADSVAKLPSEMIGRKCHELWADPGKPCDGCPVVKAFKTKRSEHTMMVKPDGRAWDEKAVPVFDADGRLIGVVEIANDITDRKAAEDALRESEERFRLAFDNANIGMSLVDTEGSLIRVNNQMSEILGYSRSELESMTVNDIAHPQDLGLGLRFMERALSGEADRAEFEKRYTHKQGHEVWGQVSSSIVRNPHGAPLYFISHVQDLTERKRVEKHIVRRDALVRGINLVLREALESSSDADIAGICLRVAEEITGSKFGFVGEINDTGRLDTIAISDPGWEACRVPESVSASSITNMEIRGIWGSVLKGEQSLIINEPASHPDSVGAPAGHPPLTSFMGIALRRSGKTCGLIALANKAGGYDASDMADVETLSSAFVEVLDRGRTERALQASREKYRNIFDNAIEGIFQSSPEGRYVTVSPAFARMFGYGSPEEMMREVVDIAHQLYARPEDREAFKRRLADPDPVESYEIELRRKDGAAIWVSVNARVIRDESGRVLYYEGTCVDVTGRKQAQESLQQSETRYRLLFDDSKDGVYITSREGEIIEANQAYFHLLGYKREEMIGGDIRATYVNPSDRDRFVQMIEAEGFLKDYPLTFRRKDGKGVHCLLTSSLRRSEDGAILGYHGIIRDVTEQKALQKQLLQSQKMEAIGTLVGGIAHDFNNLLTVMQGFSELLLAEKDQDHPDYADLQKIFHAAKNGAELVQRLLMFSRKSEPKPVPMNLNKQVLEVEKLLRRTIPKMIDIKLELSASLPEINADMSQMEQVLMNLAVNARDAMPDGGKLTVRTDVVILDEEYCRLHIEANPGEHVLLEIADTGHGIEKETVEHIFEPFFTTKEMGRGTGLGLAMVYGIVKQHNGHVTVYSEVGKGANFRVYLPAIPVELEPEVEDIAIIPRLGTETVLLVDDEEFVRDLGARILTKNGYTAIQAQNGREAVDLFKKERSQISLVILDLIMPEMGGKECLREILKIDPQAKVLVASGYSADASVKETTQMGAKGFVAKPFRMKELLRDVRKVLDEG